MASCHLGVNAFGERHGEFADGLVRAEQNVTWLLVRPTAEPRKFDKLPSRRVNSDAPSA
jgi:hypothetical protein